MAGAFHGKSTAARGRESIPVSIRMTTEIPTEPPADAQCREMRSVCLLDPVRRPRVASDESELPDSKGIGFVNERTSCATEKATILAINAKCIPLASTLVDA